MFTSRKTLPRILLTLTVSCAAYCDVLFKCVTVFECSKRPCTFLKHSKSVSAIDRGFLKDLYEEIKVQSSNESLVLFEGSVRGLHSLERLTLTDMKITAIQPNAFEDLPNLEVLDLRRNLVEEIEEGVFNVLNVTQLWLQGNRISRIATKAFDNMSYLEVVNLDNNRLTNVDTNWFGNTPNVQYLSLKQNLIEELPKRAFENIIGSHYTDDGDTVTTDIYLSKNKITTIHPDAFENLETLGDLYLNSNRLKTLSANVFSTLKNIQVLSFAKNKLVEIDDNTFSNTESIKELDISFNKLTCLPYSVADRAEKIVLLGNKGFNCSCLNKLQNKVNQNNRTTLIKFGGKTCLKKKRKPKRKRKKKMVKRKRKQ